MEFEEILAKCGNDGRYQYMLLAMLWFIAFVTSFQFFSQNVIGFMPDHWCYHEQLENRSYDDIEAIYAKFDRPSCTRLDTINGNNVTISSEPCDRWIYKYDFGFRSMNIELNWVCDSAYKAKVGQSLFFVGTMVGTLGFGALGDRFGRLKTMILANFSCCLGELLTMFSENVTTFSASRFVSGWGASCNLYLMVVLVIEYTSPKLRSVGISTVIGLGMSISGVCSAWLAVWVGHWRFFLLFTSLPLLSTAFINFLVQESAQWLITRNDIDGAIEKLRRVAQTNGRTVSEEDFKAFYSHCEESYKSKIGQDQPKLIDVLKWPRLLRRSFKLVLLFIFVSISANMISRNVEGLGISPFIMFSLNSLAVMPSGLLQGQIQKRYGRKTTSVVAMISTGLFSIALGLFMSLDQGENKYLVVSLAVATRFGISMSFQSASQFITELIPTSVRSRGLSIVHVSGNAGAFLTPYIQHMGIYWRALPFLVVALFELLGAYLCLLLPESSNKMLAISLSDGDEFGKDEGMFDFVRDIRKGRKVDDDVAELHRKEEEKLMCKSSL